jgi:hypothetical protein
MEDAGVNNRDIYWIPRNPMSHDHKVTSDCHVRYNKSRDFSKQSCPLLQSSRNCENCKNIDYHCTTSTFGDEPFRKLKVIQCCSKHCSCHLQGEYVYILPTFDAAHPRNRSCTLNSSRENLRTRKDYHCSNLEHSNKNGA